MPVDEGTSSQAGQKYPGASVRTTKGETHDGEAQVLRIHVPTADAEVVLGLSDDAHQGVRLSTSSDVYRSASTWAPWGRIDINSDEHALSNTQLALGVDERGFVGLRTTVDHGNVLICAATMGDANLGTSYHQAIRVATIIDAGIDVVRAGLLLWGKSYTGGWSTLHQVLGIGQFAWAAFDAASSPLSGGRGGGTNFDYMKTGHVQVFGARSVKLQSIEGVSSAAALFNSMSAGASASVNSIIAASVNSGVLASVNAGYMASLNANDASVVGGVGAALSSRVGTAKIEGASIRIGNKRQAGMKAKHLSGIQERTNDLWMRAQEFIEIAVPSGTQAPEVPTDYPLDGHLVNLTKPPVGIQVVRNNVRVTADKASTNVSTNEVTSLAGKSVMKLVPGGALMGRLKVAPMDVSQTALGAARQAYHTAWHTSEGVVNQLKALGPKIKAAGVTGVIGAAGVFAAAAGASTAVAAGLGASTGSRRDEAGADEGAKIGAITGAVIGSVGAATAMFLSAMKTAGIAQRAGQRAAQVAYNTAVQTALGAESVTTTLDPTAARVEVTDSHVLLSFGPPVAGSSIKVSASGIDIKGSKVTVNDMNLAMPMVPAPPTPPVMPAPAVPPPPVPQVPIDLVV